MHSILRGVAALFAAVLLLLAAPARAADPPTFNAEQLDQMLAPIALFPDALLSQVLMASTYPKDVAEAAGWAFANRSLKGDDAVRAVQDKPWDPSVQSLVAFPQVLAMLDEKPEWVQDLGDAFLAQPEDVMDSVQLLRAKAKGAGNLSSNEQQIVSFEAGAPARQTVVATAPSSPTQIITIAPANPQVIFVPIYNPVHVFGPWWHPLFPPFFFPPPVRWGFGWSPVSTAIWWGVGIGVTYALWGGVDWRRRNVNINVNQWNNINVNNRINSNNRNVNWNHNPGNRRGVPYRDASTRDRMQDRLGDRGGRQEYRGREDQRAQARAALSDRVGAENLDREALRNIDRSQIPQRTPGGDRTPAGDRAAAIDRSQARDRVGSIDRSQVQERAGNIDRSQVRDRASNIDRSQVQDRAGNIDRSPARDRANNVNRSQVQDRAGSIERSRVQDRASNIDRSQAQNRSESAARTNRDNALRGANDGRQTQQQIDRGRASQAAQRHNAPQRQSNVSRPAGGAAGQRHNAPQRQANVSRPAGGAAAQRRNQ
ncbi:DUF3300 domain-containing protein [Accumulibacter sp.]|uniref:DUF3300 domain-containing protein n=1 Tax=Accumulibacter sp. TaxID=2053492 RepID=UPI001A3DC916|nr:DUF3300 domain-containing protein [Accumulibacter sp.]MBL8373931.1 DUF3300 domain-containing protein [Accumulibacter sp.]